MNKLKDAMKAQMKPSFNFEEGSDIGKQVNFLNISVSQGKELYKKLENQIKAAGVSIESGRALGDTLKDYGNKLEPDSSLGACLKNFGDLHRNLEDLRSDLNNEVAKILYDPVKDSVKNDLQNAVEQVKKHDKNKSNYDNAVAKLRSLNEKGKVNLSKINEAETERENTKQIYETSSQETLKLVTEVNSKTEVELVARLLRCLESYQTFFEKSLLQISNMHSQLDEYYNFIEKKSESYESTFGKSLPKIVESRINLPKPSLLLNRNDDGPVFSLDDGSSDEETMEEKPDTPIDDVFERKKNLQEIVTAERAYVSNLKTLKLTYLDPLKKMQKDPKNKLSEEEVKSIFINIEELLPIHIALLERLDKCLESFPNLSIGAIFLDNIPKLRSYTVFATNFNKSIETLKDVKIKSRPVSQYLKNCEKTERFGLNRLLQMPLKRISQYEFWLEKIYSLTKTTDNDYSKLGDAVEELTKLHVSVNQSNTRANEITQIMEIQKKITGFEENLAEDDRFLLKEGVLGLIKTPIKGKKDYKVSNYYWILFNDMILYCSKSIRTGVTQVSRSPMNINKLMEINNLNGLKYKGHIPLHRLVVNDLTDTQLAKFSFELEYGTERLTVCSTSNNEKRDWLQAIKKAQEDAKKKKLFGVELQELMSRESGSSLPSFISQCLSIFLQKGLTVEGIFRLSGSAADIQATKDLLDRGKDVDLQEKDIHTLTGLFKHLLREMPDSILTNQYYNEWIEIGKMDDKIAALEATKNLLSKIPNYNRFLLQALIDLLLKVNANASTNLMGFQNISIVFGPTILHTPDNDTSNLKPVYSILHTFMTQYEELLKSVEQERKNFEERELKLIEEQKEKELAEKEKIRQGITQEKREKELKEQKQQELKEKKEMDEKAKRQKEKEEKEKRDYEERERRERELREKKIQQELEQEQAKERLRKQALEEEERRIQQEKTKKKREKEQREKELKEKREREEAEYRRRIAEEEKEYMQKVEEEERKRKEQEMEERQKRKQEEEKREKERQEQIQATLGESGCLTCGKAVTDTGLQAMGRKWHIECFVCAHCKKALTGSFMPMNNKPYCNEDFAVLFAKVCSGCGKPISGAHMKALNKEWHSTCFVCANCKGTLSQGFFEKKGKPLCKNCGNASI